MTTSKFKFCAAALISLFTLSCTKVISLKLGNDSGKLVIEGNITDVAGPQYVKLSRNVPFTGPNVYPPVTGAAVMISDDKGNTFPFTEGPAGTYSTSSVTGLSGAAYKMTVGVNGTIYTASSVMPAAVALDTLTTKANDFNHGKNRREITVHLQDPAHVANQYRFLMFVNGAQVNDTFAYNDDFFDGRDLSIDLVETDVDIFPGDTVRVEMQCIDKPVYTYWFALMQQSVNNPGGGVAPSNPPSNIVPACLGYFSAHTTQTKTIIVQ